MKFLFASDSFKGSLSSEKMIDLLTKAAQNIFPECECNGVPVADGGEGTVAAVIAATGGCLQQVIVKGPLFEEIRAAYGVFNKNHAIIEMAAASGLPLVPVEKRNPLYTTSYGTGQLIKHALENGYRKIVIAIGGSATNDGGMGAMTALGIKFLDESGEILPGTGADLGKVKRIDISGIHPAVAEAQFTIMSDVTCPLIGAEGATLTFGKQKGATPEIQTQMEAEMEQYGTLLSELAGMDICTVPGAGAAGGLGAALMVFLQAEMESGIEIVLDLIRFDERLDGVDLVVTGEGRMDWQSALGKVPGGVAKRCKNKGIPVLAIVGGIGDGAAAIYELGVGSIATTVNGAMDIDEAINRAAELYQEAAERSFRMIHMGMLVGDKAGNGICGNNKSIGTRNIM